MRIVFYGTPDFAVASLSALVENGHNVVAVVTAPDRPAGRGHKMLPSAVKIYSESKKLPVMQPTNLKSEDFINELTSYSPDIQIVVAFRMLPKTVWDLPPLGTFNVHAALLPNYRGAAPINWAIINVEVETGVSTFKLQHEIDTGSILLQEKASIGEDETAGELYNRLMNLGASLLLESLNLIDSGNYELVPQVVEEHHKVAPKIFKADCEIDWSRSKKEIHDFVRGLNPFPGAFTYFEHQGVTDRMKVLSVRPIDSSQTGELGSVLIEDSRILVQCSDGCVELLDIQLPGKRQQNANDFVLGNRTLLEQARLIVK